MKAGAAGLSGWVALVLLLPMEAGVPIPIPADLVASVPDDGARLIALPAPVRAMASFPVRAVAVLNGP